MKNCMNKIYFPIKPINDKLRQDEQRKEQLIKYTKNLVLGNLFSKSQATEFDLHKNQLLTQVIQVKTAEEQADDELNKERDQVEQHLDAYIFRIHG